MPVIGATLAAGLRLLVRSMLAVYFSRIDSFHPDRVPVTGPVVFASNHPGSITDAFIIGTTLPRRVHFVGTVRLFRAPPLAWLLRQCGVIPINRRQDDPTAMRTVARTFEACDRVLEDGGAIGIFPEGVTYEDASLKPVKTGTARLTLALEARHDGHLGVTIVPVGLTYSAKERYRTRVLVHFGEPIGVAAWLPRYRDQEREAIRDLSDHLAARLSALIVDLQSLGQARIVESVRRLYLDRLRVGRSVVGDMPAQARDLLLTQGIAQALQHFQEHDSERLERFLGDLSRYERRLDRLRLSDGEVRDLSRSGGVVRYFSTAVLLVGLAPLALYGWLHRWPPLRVVTLVIERLTHEEARRAQTPHATMLAGLVAFGGFYALYVTLVWRWFGVWPAFWYALSLPASGLLAHSWVRAARRYRRRVRAAAVLLRAPFATRVIRRSRARLLAQLGTLRREYERAMASG